MAGVEREVTALRQQPGPQRVMGLIRLAEVRERLTAQLLENRVDSRVRCGLDDQRRLARKLGPYSGDGPYAGFFDGPNAFTLDRALTVVELSGLRGTPDVQAALMFVLLHQLTLFFAAPGRLL